MRSPRSRSFLLAPLLLSSLLAVGCGAHDPDIGQTGDDLSANALVGTWDVVGSDADGLTRTGTITIGKASLTVSFGDYTLRFADDPAGATTLFDDRSSAPVVTRAISTVHSPQPLASGIVPLSLGGDWVLSDATNPNAACTAFLSGDRFASQCNGVQIQPGWLEFYASHPYPYWAWDGWTNGWLAPPPAVAAWEADWSRFWNRNQIPSPNGDFTGVRVRALASSFGDLGGEWELAGSGGAICHATLSDATFTSACSGIVGDESQGDANGSITIRFGNGVASGSSSKGIEISARRVHS